jgi:hypothetical protein
MIMRPPPFHSSRDEAWERIAPAVPDVLSELRFGVYEAIWWQPVPWHEVDLLLKTEGIVIVLGPYEPPALPNGCAVQFSVLSAASCRVPTGLQTNQGCAIGKVPF